jgi:molybdate transport repressor ModE-like protein
VNIQTFLCVARCGSISGAAAMLFISQSAVSTRLRQLEEALGTPLVERRQGSRSIVLTARGEAFLPLAERWTALSAETAAFSRAPLRSALTVAGPDSLNLYLLEPLYRRLTEPAYQLALRVRTQQSQEIFSLIENREADVGFAFNLFRSESVRCRKLLAEKTVLLLSGSTCPASSLTPRDLDPGREVFLPWSQDFQLWHDSLWPAAQNARIQVDTVALTVPLLRQEGTWCFAPKSVAKALRSQGLDLTVVPFSEEPPDRICCILTHRDPHSRAQAATERFREALVRFLEEVCREDADIALELRNGI